jgi:hypothetical protein
MSAAKEGDVTRIIVVCIPIDVVALTRLTTDGAWLNIVKAAGTLPGGADGSHSTLPIGVSYAAPMACLEIKTARRDVLFIKGFSASTDTKMSDLKVPAPTD